jgi:hypothetical protein
MKHGRPVLGLVGFVGLVGLVGLVVTAVLAGPAAPTARAETVDQAYRAALKHYYAGRYKEAVAGLERILSIPVSDEDLHYNLGCAYFRLGKRGRAIYHFERALLLDPEGEDARYNLRTVRAMVASRVKDEIKGAAGEAWWARLSRALSATSWAVLFLVLWWLVFGILFTLRYIRPGPSRSGLIATNCFVGLLALVCGLLLAARVWVTDVAVTGIVLPDRLAVREGPDATTKTTFKVHAGLRVRVQGGEGSWIRIRLANGLEGWVPKREVGVL